MPRLESLLRRLQLQRTYGNADGSGWISKTEATRRTALGSQVRTHSSAQIVAQTNRRKGSKSIFTRYPLGSLSHSAMPLLGLGESVVPLTGSLSILSGMDREPCKLRTELEIHRL